MENLFTRASALIANVEKVPPSQREEKLRAELDADPELASMFDALCRPDSEGNPSISGRLDEFAALLASIRTSLRDVPARPASRAADPGDRYEVVREIGSGGMGSIFEVEDRKLRRTLAMKVIRADGSFSDPGTPLGAQILVRFQEEAQVTGQLEHPGIVPVHDFGIDSNGRTFFTMRLIRGQSLATVFATERDERALDFETRLARGTARLLKVCEAVAFAHSKRVVHRDLKPANVMVGRFGEVYVMDWGLARVLGSNIDASPSSFRRTDSIVRTDRDDARDDSTIDGDSPYATSIGDVVGTPAYMAPEQARGENDRVDERSDIYSVGAMIYELVAGSAPYSEADRGRHAREILRAVLVGPPEPIRDREPRVPPELEAITQKAMAREASQRYASMVELADDLRAYLENRVVRAHATGAIAELRKWIARNRTIAWTSLVSLLILSIFGAVFSWFMKEQRDDARKETQRADRLARLEAASRDDAERKLRVATVLAAQSRLDSADLTTARELMKSLGSESDGFVERFLRDRCWPATVDVQAFDDFAGDLVFGPEERWFAVSRGHPTAKARPREATGPEVRIFALPDGAPLRDLSGLGMGARDLTITRDGKTVIAGGADRIVAWDPDTGAVRWVVGLEDDEQVTGSLLYLEACPERLLVVRSGGVEWRELDGGRRTRAVRPTPKPLDLSVVGSVTGRYVIVGDRDDEVSVFDVEDERILANYDAIRGQDVVGATFVGADDTEKALLLVTADAAIHGFELAGRKDRLLLSVEPDSSDIAEMRWGMLRPRTAFDARRKVLWVGAHSGVIHEIPIGDRRTRAVVQTSAEPTSTVVVSPSGEWLAALDFSGFVHVVDLTAKDEQAPQAALSLRFVRFAADPDHFVAGLTRRFKEPDDGGRGSKVVAFLRTYDFASGVCVRQLGPYPTRSGFKAVDVRHGLALIDDPSGAGRIVRLEDGASSPTPLTPEDLDGPAGLIGESREVILGSRRELRRVDLTSGEVRAKASAPAGVPTLLVVDDSRRRVAIRLRVDDEASDDESKTVPSTVWCVRTDTLATEWVSHRFDDAPGDLAFSPDGTRLFVTRHDGGVSEIEFREGEQPVSRDLRDVTGVASVSRPGFGSPPELVVGGRDGSIRVLDGPSGIVLLSTQPLTRRRSTLDVFASSVFSRAPNTVFESEHDPVEGLDFDPVRGRILFSADGVLGRLPADRDPTRGAKRRSWAAELERARPIVESIVASSPEIVAAYTEVAGRSDLDPSLRLAVEYLLADSRGLR